MRITSFGKHALWLATTVLAAASIHLESAAQSSTGSLREWQAAEDRQLADIDAEITANGPFSAQLFEMFYSLAQHYLERDSHRLAAEALEQALHVQRVTHGLFSLEQAAVIQDLRESSLAIGDLERVLELDGQLVRIANENLFDIRSADILVDAADRRMTVYERYLAGEMPPQLNISFGQGLGSGRQLRDDNRSIANFSLLAARRHYLMAINVIVGADEPTDPRIVEIERNLIRSYFLQANSGDLPRGMSTGLFRLGRDSYQRILLFALEANDFEVAAEGMIGLADWYLMFQRFGTALKMYADAFAELERLGAPQELLDTIFSPEVPIALPSFNPNPLATRGEPADDADGAFLDIRMKLSRYGRSRLRDFESSADDTLKPIAKRIRRIVSRGRFRPMIVDGEPQHGHEIEFRYYLPPERS